MARRSRLVEEDKVFLSRLWPPSRRSTFASYVFDEIRGHKWRREPYHGLKSTNPDDILQEVLSRLHAQIVPKRWDAHLVQHLAQWYEAMVLHSDEARRYVCWCLAWEKRSKIEQRASRWRQYEAYQQAQATDEDDVSNDLTPVVDAWACQVYGPFGALEHPWHELQEAYVSAHSVWNLR